MVSITNIAHQVQCKKVHSIFNPFRLTVGPKLAHFLVIKLYKRVRL